MKADGCQAKIKRRRNFTSSRKWLDRDALRIKSYRNCLSYCLNLLLKYTIWGRISISSHTFIVIWTDHKEGRNSGLGPLRSATSSTQDPRDDRPALRTLESTRVTSKLKVFSSARKMSVLTYNIPIFLENLSQAQRQTLWPSQSRGCESSEIKFSQQRWRRPRCSDTGPGTHKEMPRWCDDCCPRCYRSCCPSKSNTPICTQNHCLYRVNPWQGSKSSDLWRLESNAKTQGREEAGQLSPLPCPHSCWGFSPCWLPMARVFCCYKHDQS